MLNNKWAASVAANPGLPNLHRVSSTLYRSAQPTEEGFAFLETSPSLSNGDAPIKTVFSLRAFHHDIFIADPKSNVLKFKHVLFKTWHPEDEDVIKFLRVVNTKALQPVLVHCLHGSDRTGTMCAIYRIVHDGWTEEQAVDEMMNGGFGFHPIWQNLIRYIENLDISFIKAQVLALGDWDVK